MRAASAVRAPGVAGGWKRALYGGRRGLPLRDD